GATFTASSIRIMIHSFRHGIGKRQKCDNDSTGWNVCSKSSLDRSSTSATGLFAIMIAAVRCMA
ncbi:MAG TPA: hypothetical protein PLA74_11290, partial [Syntrophales bacterium]|nr:hypothetical protein [Syntrophales bacterium]